MILGLIKRKNPEPPISRKKVRTEEEEEENNEEEDDDSEEGSNSDEESDQYSDADQALAETRQSRAKARGKTKPKPKPVRMFRSAVWKKQLIRKGVYKAGESPTKWFKK